MNSVCDNWVEPISAAYADDAVARAPAFFKRLKAQRALARTPSSSSFKRFCSAL